VSDGSIDNALQFLHAAGAESVEHPGGTLLAHLQRVSALLASWQAPPELVLAGLCHAFYGTDGFAVSLLDLGRRAELAAAIGDDAEALVYFYASCDRKASYADLTEADGRFVDRFTDEPVHPTGTQRRAFAELTAANELDIAAVSSDMRERHGPQLLRLFDRWRPLLSDAAWKHCQAVLGSAKPGTQTNKPS
jgi:hypothetical protein